VRHVAFGKGENVRSWHDITKDMEALADNLDWEASHARADALLVEALRSHATATDYKLVEALIEAYESLSKWYA